LDKVTDRMLPIRMSEAEPGAVPSICSTSILMSSERTKARTLPFGVNPSEAEADGVAEGALLCCTPEAVACGDAAAGLPEGEAEADGAAGARLCAEPELPLPEEADRVPRIRLYTSPVILETFPVIVFSPVFGEPEGDAEADPEAAADPDADAEAAASPAPHPADSARRRATNRKTYIFFAILYLTPVFLVQGKYIASLYGGMQESTRYRRALF
jgi:hypothetical protein